MSGTGFRAFPSCRRSSKNAAKASQCVRLVAMVTSPSDWGDSAGTVFYVTVGSFMVDSPVYRLQQNPVWPAFHKRHLSQRNQRFLRPKTETVKLRLPICSCVALCALSCLVEYIR